MPKAEERIRSAIQIIEIKQAEKEAKNERTRMKYKHDYGVEKNLKDDLVLDEDERIENLEKLEEIES